jgi:hypothetical protein
MERVGKLPFVCRNSYSCQGVVLSLGLFYGYLDIFWVSGLIGRSDESGEEGHNIKCG